MKVFDKWLTKNGSDDYGYAESAEDGWRGAMEEVLKHTVKDTCSLMTELRDWIKEELKE